MEEQLKTLTEEGTKALKLGEFGKATESFSEASELSIIIYGNDSEEYAKALYYYGWALLENAITQNDVLANNVISANAQATTGMITEEAISNDDDQTEDLQLAWQILELARVTYLKVDDSKDKEKSLGEIYIKLGDVSLESENLDQAAIDYQEGIKIKTKILPEDNRELAEAYWKLAIALELLPDRSQLESAIDYVQKAIIVLQNRKGNLKPQLIALQEKVGKGKQVATTDDEDSSIIEKEIKEIDEFLVEMEAKLEDLKNVKSSNDEPELKPIDMAMDEYVKLLPETRQSLITAAATAIATNIDSSSSSSSPSIAINDLTPLIKKKSTTTTVIEVDNNNNKIDQEKKRTLELDENNNHDNEDIKKPKISDL